MREILFRGKTPGGEWKLGYLNQHRGIDEYDTCYEKIRSCDFYIFDYAEKIGSGLYGCVYKVLPETVGQYTGLNDKNGVKIFEGDIVFDGRDNYVVKYGEYNCGCCGYVYGFAGCNDKYYWRTILSYFKDVEVIGNIFENPELIGGDAE